jgi:hypothetical protein
MLLAFDVAFSLLSTCQENYPAAAGHNHDKNHCTALGGVIPWVVGVSLHPLTRFLETYEHSLIAGFTIVLAVFTARLWYSTEKLWKATRDTAKTQERDTRILQRAYLAVSPQGIQPLSGNSTGICVAHICIRNVGRLPARDVTWFIESTISDDPAFNEMDVARNLAAGEITIAPGIDVVQGSGMIFGSELEKAQASQPSKFCYVWGVVYYVDGFTNVRMTRFCHAYNCANLKDVYAKAELTLIVGKTIAADTARYHRYGNDAT